MGRQAGGKVVYEGHTGVVRGVVPPPVLLEGDCLALMGDLGDNTVDLVFTDPGVGGGEFERGVPGVPYWAEMHRVAKPGAHLAVFSGRKYSHRVVTAAEDAGWEPRDTLMWVYPKGMPMALDIGQAVDKKLGGPGEPYFRTAGSMTDEQRATLDKSNPWFGWGTELRPTWEPISILRKRPEGSVADNVLAWGTGAMNIDATRVEGVERDAIATWIPPDQGDAHGLALQKFQQVVGKTTLGRWPADALFSHGSGCVGERCVADCAVAALEREFEGTAKFFYCPKADRREKDLGVGVKGNKAKSVKPVTVCRWVVDLLLPPGGLLLDPFCGTGSIGLGGIRLDGMGVSARFVGMDVEGRWLDVAQRRWGAFVELLQDRAVS